MATIFGFLYMGCKLAPPEEYDWTVHVRRRCVLMSNYFDHLFLFPYWTPGVGESLPGWLKKSRSGQWRINVMLVCMQHWNQWRSKRGDGPTCHRWKTVSSFSECSITMHQTNVHSAEIMTYKWLEQSLVTNVLSFFSLVEGRIKMHEYFIIVHFQLFLGDRL